VSRFSLRAFDVLVLVLLALAEADALLGDDDGPTVALVLFPLGWTLPLLLRRRYPAVASLAVVVTMAVESQVAQPATESTTALGAVIAAFYVAGTIPDRSRALAVLFVGTLLGGVIIASDPSPLEDGDVIFLAILAGAPFLAGMTIGTRERRAEEERAEALSDERARIARELHDVVGHAISVMTVQAGAARLLIDDRPDDARDALLAAEAAGRQAIGDLHRMLGVLREGDAGEEFAPQPGLGDLERLLDRVRQSGLPVALAVEGEPREVAPGVELAAYRIVQEALTNVIRHAEGAPARVRLRYAADAIEVDVVNDRGRRAANHHGAGHGLVGMRERAALYGGELDAAALPEGGFAVHARLPVGAGAQA
jgi:signal transduction histidine kinase